MIIEKYPRAHVDIFGSFSTDSSLYNADIDVALTCRATAEAEDRINMSEL